MPEYLHTHLALNQGAFRRVKAVFSITEVQMVARLVLQGRMMNTEQIHTEG